jgi:LPS O-antigen subunit length determinant protein (WzzB/FepE family)
MHTFDPKRAPANLDGPPSGYFLVVPPADIEDETDAIDLIKIGGLLREKWKLLLAMTLLGALIAGAVALEMRTVYRARAIVAPTAESQGGQGGLKKELGGIAELAGIDIGNGGGRKVEALAVLNSKGFVRDFIIKNDLLPILFAERWDAKSKTWAKTPPTMEIAVKRFMGRRTIDENTKSGLVTIDFVWYSPEIAAQWTNGMIDMINDRMRDTDVRTADNSLDYLNRELGNANGVELRQAIAHLIENQVDNKMVANVQRDYAYHFIDRAIPPETKSGPWRSLITAGGAVLGFMLGAVFVIVRRRTQRAAAASC